VVMTPAAYTMVEAVAEAWASIDGKLEGFRHGQEFPDSDRARCEGYYDGYMHEAAELLERIEARGYRLVRVR
jgi:hypothetical protein